MLIGLITMVLSGLYVLSAEFKMLYAFLQVLDQYIIIGIIARIEYHLERKREARKKNKRRRILKGKWLTSFRFLMFLCMMAIAPLWFCIMILYAPIFIWNWIKRRRAK